MLYNTEPFGRERAARGTADRLLGEHGNRVWLIFCEFICLASFFFPFLLTNCFSLIAGFFPSSENAFLFILYMPYVVLPIAFFLLSLPVCFGAYRVAVKIVEGGKATITDCFYYYGSGKLFSRSLGLSLRLILRFLPSGVLLFFAGFFWRLLNENPDMIPSASVYAWVILLTIVDFFAALFLPGVFFCRVNGAVALALSSEDLTLREAFSFAKNVSDGERMRGFRFFYSSALRMFLALLPVGVPLLLHSCPRAMLASADYAARTFANHSVNHYV